MTENVFFGKISWKIFHLGSSKSWSIRRRLLCIILSYCSNDFVPFSFNFLYLVLRTYVLYYTRWIFSQTKLLCGEIRASIPYVPPVLFYHFFNKQKKRFFYFEYKASSRTTTIQYGPYFNTRSSKYYNIHSTIPRYIYQSSNPWFEEKNESVSRLGF